MGQGRGAGQLGHRRVSFLPGVRFRDTQSRRSSRQEYSEEAWLDFTHSRQFLLVSFLREEETSPPDGVENAVSLLQGSLVLGSTRSSSVSWYLRQRTQGPTKDMDFPVFLGSMAWGPRGQGQELPGLGHHWGRKTGMMSLRTYCNGPSAPTRTICSPFLSPLDRPPHSLLPPNIQARMFRTHFLGSESAPAVQTEGD